jgi:outer membrane protein assembly factor BamD (BamD/ComL family)
MRYRTLLLSLLLLAGCGVAPLERLAASREADSLVRQADAQLRSGNPAAAIRILEDVTRRFPDASVHDKALYELARTLVLTATSPREYRQAATVLDRLLREHPTSPYVSDARALRIVLGAYVARTAELDRLLERLRAIDLEFERPRQP